MSFFLYSRLGGTRMVPTINIFDIPQPPEPSETSGPEWEDSELDWDDHTTTMICNQVKVKVHACAFLLMSEPAHVEAVNIIIMLLCVTYV